MGKVTLTRSLKDIQFRHNRFFWMLLSWLLTQSGT